jgi:hypothetical protein
VTPAATASGPGEHRLLARGLDCLPAISSRQDNAELGAIAAAMNVAFRSSRERRSLPGFEPVAAPQLFHIEPHGKYANCDQADVKQ